METGKQEISDEDTECGAGNPEVNGPCGTDGECGGNEG